MMSLKWFLILIACTSFLHLSHFNYIDKRLNGKEENHVSYEVNNYPSSLDKKVTLLMRFKSYIENKHSIKLELELKPKDKGNEVLELVYVKKWIHIGHAIVFRLSNKVVQVNFKDRTEMVMSLETREVTYTNKQGERETYSFSNALESTDTELTKKLNYTKDILTYMLTSNQRSESTYSL